MAVVILSASTAADNAAWFLVVTLVAMITTPGHAQWSTTDRQSVKIGVLIDSSVGSETVEHCLRLAFHRVNARRTATTPHYTLRPFYVQLQSNNTFLATKQVCQLLDDGVVAVLGPTVPDLAWHVRSLCAALDVPHMRWSRGSLGRHRHRRSSSSSGQPVGLNVDLFPEERSLQRAFSDLVTTLQWRRILIIFEEDKGLMMMQEFFRTLSESVEIHTRRVNRHNMERVLHDAKLGDFFNILVDVPLSTVQAFLKMVVSKQMHVDNYHYIFTSLDIGTLDMSFLNDHFVNITAFQLVDSDYVAMEAASTTAPQLPRAALSANVSSSTIQIRSEEAIAYDSVLLLARAVQALLKVSRLDYSHASCSAGRTSTSGASLFNYINMVYNVSGMSGNVELVSGHRRHFRLGLVKLYEQKIVQVGRWTERRGLVVEDRAKFFATGNRNVTLVVTANLNRPYVMLRNEPQLTGNDRFEGFSIDLLRALSEAVGFNYTIVLNPDGLYGAKSPETGQWNGIVRQLIDKRADIAIGSFSINFARESVIDFTKPFMNLGISILFKVPSSTQARLFSFMNPLALEIWLYMLAAYVLVSLSMFVVARFSPGEWHSPHPCHRHSTTSTSAATATSDTLENQFSLADSLWFTIGTLMQQGSDLNPKAISTRIVGGMWWFFTLIMISSYTANLAAFLTVERMITPIASVEDLAEQSEISYGALEGGSTMSFFRDSKMDTYRKIWRFMDAKKSTVFTKTYEDGIRRVIQGDYAFLAESTTIDYIVNRNCNLTQIGDLLDSKGYGIATTRGSPWTDALSLAILELQEKSVIHTLYNKWWRDTSATCRRELQQSNKANALGLDSIGGIFIVLILGLAFAVCVAIFEFCWMSRTKAHIDKQSVWREMLAELQFVVQCRGGRHRPALNRHCSPCLTPVLSQSCAPAPATAPANANAPAYQLTHY